MSDTKTHPHSAPLQAAYALGGQPCTREAFYAMACDPQRNVVVQACAGAGKTWMLVSRILRALLDAQTAASSLHASDAETDSPAALAPHTILRCASACKSGWKHLQMLTMQP
jgi:UvrD/REP helicase N-terminal domain